MTVAAAHTCSCGNVKLHRPGFGYCYPHSHPQHSRQVLLRESLQVGRSPGPPLIIRVQMNLKAELIGRFSRLTEDLIGSSYIDGFGLEATQYRTDMLSHCPSLVIAICPPRSTARCGLHDVDWPLRESESIGHCLAPFSCDGRARSRLRRLSLSISTCPTCILSTLHQSWIHWIDIVRQSPC